MCFVGDCVVIGYCAAARDLAVFKPDCVVVGGSVSVHGLVLANMAVR